ncbi:MAG: DUF58 domain-containing protein [Myxococcaceae bacterium]|nr:DUF58 domain-containing protein [Myxococcaceae bacterium]
MPLRFAGLILVAAAGAALRFSEAEVDYLLRPVALVALALVAVCVALVLVTTLVVRRVVKGQPAGVPPELESGAELTTSFRVPNVRALGLLDVSLEWVTPPGFRATLVRAEGRLGERVSALERGRHDTLVRRLTVEDVFGLSALSFEVSWPITLRVTPVAAPVSATLAASRSSGDAWSHPSGRAEGDLVEMRSYAHGDSMRHVLWRTFARTRRLLVRMPERAVAPQPLNVAFLIAGAHDEPTAGVARVFLEQGLLGPDFVFAADGALKPTTRVPEAIEQIIDSVRVRGEGARGLDGLATQVEPHRLGACVVFAPPVDGAWREKLVAMSRRLSVPATVIIGVDTAGDEVAAPPARVPKWMLREDAAVTQATHLVALREKLEADGFPVRVVHRPTGKLV